MANLCDRLSRGEQAAFAELYEQFANHMESFI